MVEADGEIGIVRSCPAIGDTIARQQGVVFHAEVGPKGLAVVVVNAVLQVEDDAAILVFRIGIAMDASVFRGCQLGFDAIILQKHLIITWHGYFRVMAETGTVTRIGVGLRPRVELDFSRYGYHQDIAQIRVPSATEMGMTEAHDSTIFMLITSAILIHSQLINTIDVVWHSVGVGAELHDTEGRTSTWEGMPHAVRPDDRVDILDIIGNGF